MFVAACSCISLVAGRKWWRETDIAFVFLPSASPLPPNKQEVEGEGLSIKVLLDSGVGLFGYLFCVS